MKQKKGIFKQKTRQDISNPNKDIPHLKLLKKIQAINLKDNFHIEHLQNGIIAIHPINDNNKYF
jgi:hypothetical protein